MSVLNSEIYFHKIFDSRPIIDTLQSKARTWSIFIRCCRHWVSIHSTTFGKHEVSDVYLILLSCHCIFNTLWVTGILNVKKIPFIGVTLHQLEKTLLCHAYNFKLQSCSHSLKFYGLISIYSVFQNLICDLHCTLMPYYNIYSLFIKLFLLMDWLHSNFCLNNYDHP